MITEFKDLRPGWYWARFNRAAKDEPAQWGDWVPLELLGQIPFLYFAGINRRQEIYPNEDMSNVQFGPRIENRPD